MELVNTQTDRGCATVTMNRPPVNAQSTELYRELISRLDEANNDPSVRVIILGSDVKGMFSAGIDMKEFSDTSSQSVQLRNRRTALGYDLWYLLRTSRAVTIAAVDGAAVGGGLLVALCCDIRIASPEARFCLPELKVGGTGGIALLRRAGVAEGDARRIFLSAEFMDAAEAFRCHVVNQLSTEASAIEAAIELADKLTEYNPDTLLAAKQSLLASENAMYEIGIHAERRAIEQHRRATSSAG